MKTPASWDEANAWELNANEDKINFFEPKWKFDCNFKLDFDGALVGISSRFYPPHYNPKTQDWDGQVDIIIGGSVKKNKKFRAPTLDELRVAVEKYVKSIKVIVEAE